MTKATKTLIELLIEDKGWNDLPLESLCRQAADAVFDRFDAVGLTPEISVLACGDARIAVLNRDFRDKPVATNVLSWPSVERGATQDGDLPEALDAADDPEIGDIAISLQTCLREAEEMNKPVEHHVLHLVVHAILHLLGYDHERDKDAALMEHTETEILASLGVPDPY